MYQKGFSQVIILIAIAVVAGIAVVVFGILIIGKGATPPQQVNTQPAKIPLTKEDPLQPQVGTPDCPELDYTGCDNSGNFMTWTDDGVR